MLTEVASLIARRPMSPEDRAHRLDVATRLSHACGCETSGAFGSVALVAALIWVVQPGNADLAHLGLAAVAVLVAGLAGKALGIGLARVRLWLVLRELQRWPAA
jgi:hypothetical protein